MATFMPIIRPLVSSSGPPELPGFMAASVWMIDFISPPVRLGKRPVQVRNDAGGQSALQAKRIAQRVHSLADPQIVRRADRNGIELLGRGFDLENGNVGIRIGAHQFRRRTPCR